jgi:cytoskeleton protein RodZ
MSDGFVSGEGPGSDPGSPSPASTPRTAGSILREARQAQGLHIAALAASIKVAQKKLEALEADRLDELHDATFTRALAQTVCRALKIDPAPVLALLPAPGGYRLEQVGEGINAPFRDRPGRREPSDWSAIVRPAIWAPLLLLIAAAAIYFLPSGWLPQLPSLPSPQPASAASAAASPDATPGTTSSVMMAPAPVVEVASAPGVNPPVVAPEPAASGPLGAVSGANAPNTAAASELPVATSTLGSGTQPDSGEGALQIHAKAATWVEVRDASSRVLIGRTVPAGETLALNGAAPLRVKIGNARETEVSYRGRVLDLSANTSNNVARIELK